MAGFIFLRRAFGFHKTLLRRLHRGGEGFEVAETAGLLGELLLVALDIGEFLVEPRQPVAMGTDVALELVALGGEIGERGGQFGEQALGGGQCRFRFGDAFIDAATLLDAGLDLVLQLCVFGIEPLQRHPGVGSLLLLAADIGGKLRQPAVELGDALFGALFLAIEHLAGAGEPLQPGRGAGLALAQCRQFGSTDGLDTGRFGLLTGAFGHLADAEVMGRGGFRHPRMGIEPAQMKQQRLGLAHLGRDFAVADRLPRLLLEAFHLSGELSDYVLDTGQIGFGGLEAQFGLMASGVKPGDAGGVFQHAAALFGFRLDDLADLALVNQRRRTGAGGGIRKQNLHIAGADVAAVDAIDRACLALDPARDFQDLAVVDRGRRGAIGVIDRHHDFGVVARRTVAGTGEDHRVHVGGAQRFVRGLAHRPAQCLDQIGLAAAVRADHPGEAGFDHEISGFNERLETVEAKAREFHESRFSVGRARIFLPGQYHGRQCQCCGRVASRGSDGPTMARPGLLGNRRTGLFPRLFLSLFSRLLLGLSGADKPRPVLAPSLSLSAAT